MRWVTLFVAVAGCCASGALASCVGDDPANLSSTTPGQPGGPCLANGICNANATCIDNVCVRLPDGGSGSPFDGATDDSDGASHVDAAGDAAPLSCPYSLAPAVGPTCPRAAAGTCPGNQTCCTANDGAVGCVPNGQVCSPGATEIWVCDSRADCGPTAVCCLTGPAISPTSTVCPLNTGSGIGSTQCQTSCGTSVQMCDVDSECPSDQRCTQVKIQRVSASATVYGICQSF